MIRNHNKRLSTYYLQIFFPECKINTFDQLEKLELNKNQLYIVNKHQTIFVCPMWQREVLQQSLREDLKQSLQTSGIHTHTRI